MSRENTSRYDPKYTGLPPTSVPAFTACPHGLASDAAVAPGNVLSSLALSTFALSQYASASFALTGACFLELEAQGLKARSEQLSRASGPHS